MMETEHKTKDHQVNLYPTNDASTILDTVFDIIDKRKILENNEDRKYLFLLISNQEWGFVNQDHNAIYKLFKIKEICDNNKNISIIFVTSDNMTEHYLTSKYIPKSNVFRYNNDSELDDIINGIFDNFYINKNTEDIIV